MCSGNELIWPPIRTDLESTQCKFLVGNGNCRCATHRFLVGANCVDSPHIKVIMKLFVGNLPWSVSDQDLEQLFAQFGSVDSAKVVTDRDTGRSRGFGFVEMSDDSARAAIAGLNETEHSGRKLTVNEARDRNRR